jgi:hypothetical protein
MQGVTGQGKAVGKMLERFRGLPKGTLVPVEAVVEALSSPEAPAQGGQEHPIVGAPAPASWRVLLWTVPPETRIGREELLQAVARPRSWVYRHTAPKAASRIPHRKLDGELVFIVGEVRHWLVEREEIVQAGPLDGPRLAVAR